MYSRYLFYKIRGNIMIEINEFLGVNLKKDVKFFIIIFVYNEEKYIRKCLDLIVKVLEVYKE